MTWKCCLLSKYPNKYPEGVGSFPHSRLAFLCSKPSVEQYVFYDFFVSTFVPLLALIFVSMLICLSSIDFGKCQLNLTAY